MPGKDSLPIVHRASHVPILNISMLVLLYQSIVFYVLNRAVLNLACLTLLFFFYFAVHYHRLGLLFRFDQNLV